MNRRDILRAIALGGGVIAGELWWPGKKVISIPSGDGIALPCIQHPLLPSRVTYPIPMMELIEIPVLIDSRTLSFMPPDVFDAIAHHLGISREEAQRRTSGVGYDTMRQHFSPDHEVMYVTFIHRDEVYSGA